MKQLFSGGIHPADGKRLTVDSPFKKVTPPESVTILLRQHIGAPCSPLVKEGDRVCIGQKIGDGTGMCVPVHASVSGVVTRIGSAPHPGGGEVAAITIQNDFKDTELTLTPCADPDALNAEELLCIIREAGIVGMGGATFPTDVKARGAVGAIDTLLINACECEPYITADDALLRAFPKQMLQGVKLLQQSLKPKEVVVAIEDNKPVAAEALNKYLPEFPQLRLQLLPTRYPQGAEKQLVLAVTGRQVPPGKLPGAVGCAVFNAHTVFAIWQAVYERRPLTRRIVSVTGEAVAQPQNFVAPIGTSFAHLLSAAGGLKEEAVLMLAGGPMMGVAQLSSEVPTVKGTGAVLCLPVRKKAEHPTCIRCGKCVSVCPMHL